jgi:hypothetical protein
LLVETCPSIALIFTEMVWMQVCIELCFTDVWSVWCPSKRFIGCTCWMCHMVLRTRWCSLSTQLRVLEQEVYTCESLKSSYPSWNSCLSSRRIMRQ